MRFRPAIALVLAFTLSLPLLLAGCSARTHQRPQNTAPSSQTGRDFDVFSGEFENTPLMVESPPARLAVLPFAGDPANWSLPPEAEDPRVIVRRGMYNNIAGLPFSDQEIAETDTLLAAAELLKPDAVTRQLKTDPKRLHSLLGVDAVVVGEVTHFDRTFAGVLSQAAVGCDVRMVALPSGKLLWRARHVSRGFGGGVSITPIGLALSAFSSLWNMRDEQLYREADALFREMAGTIRVPEQGNSSLPAPVIDLFHAKPSGDFIRIDGNITFRVVGTPAARAFVELPQLSKTVELRPVSPSQRNALRGQLMASLRQDMSGATTDASPELLAAALSEIDNREIFEGTYRPVQGDEASKVMPKALIVSPDGKRTVRVLPETFDIDAAPPKAPAGIRAKASDKRVIVQWSPVRAGDIAEYEVWASERGLSGYHKIAATEDTRAVIRNLPNFTPRFFRITARDKAGNRSAMTPMRKVTPMPAAGLAKQAASSPILEGEVTRQLYLPQELSPYTVERTLNIKQGGELHVAPGVTILFARNAALNVDGGTLKAYGNADAPITFRPATHGGSWQGILSAPSASITLRHTAISSAQVGLRVTDSAPTLIATRISQSSQAALQLNDNAAPHLRCSTIENNDGMGGIVAQGKGIDVVAKDVTFRGNQPFDLQNFTGLPLDLTGNYWADPPRLLGPADTSKPLAAPANNCPMQ